MSQMQVGTDISQNSSLDISAWGINKFETLSNGLVYEQLKTISMYVYSLENNLLRFLIRFVASVYKSQCKQSKQTNSAK